MVHWITAWETRIITSGALMRCDGRASCTGKVRGPPPRVWGQRVDKGIIMSSTSKKTFYLLAVVVALLALLSMACDDTGDFQDVADDIPRIGDGMKIGEKLEQTVCESGGGKWDNRSNTCK
jgi:hypothetical protein